MRMIANIEDLYLMDSQELTRMQSSFTIKKEREMLQLREKVKKLPKEKEMIKVTLRSRSICILIQ